MEDPTRDMTELSKKMYSKAAASMTLSQALDVLENGDYRTIGSVLSDYAGQERPVDLLARGFMANHPDLSWDSASHRVRNWFNGAIRAISKEDAFEVSLILGLDLKDAERMTGLITEEGFHWRDPADVVWAYGIQNKLPYTRIRELLDTVKAMDLTEAAPAQEPEHFTRNLKDKLEPLLQGSEEQLLTSMAASRGAFGEFHNTAFSLFQAYMKLLLEGSTETVTKDLHVRDVLEKNLCRKLVPQNKKGDHRVYSEVQKVIRKNWPNETVLSKIASRELDIPRKVMILLFLATDGSNSSYQTSDDELFLLSRDDIFRSNHNRMNRMLRSCGYRELDPRNHFDWLVLLCICAEDVIQTEKRLRLVLSHLYDGGNENP